MGVDNDLGVVNTLDCVTQGSDHITAPPGAKTMAEILGHTTDSAAAKAASVVAKAAPLAG